MIKLALILIPLHSALAVLDYWLGPQTPLSGTPFYLFASMINLAFLASWINDTHNDTRDNPATSIWQSVNMTGAFIIAAAHPYLGITQSLGGGWQAHVQFEVATIGWLFALPQSGTQWLQTLYALSMLGILAAALFALLRGLLHLTQIKPKPASPKTQVPNLAPQVELLQKQIEKLTRRIEAAEGQITRSALASKTPQGRNRAGAAQAFAKLLDEGESQ